MNTSQLQNMVPNPVVENDTSNGSLPVNQADIFKSDHQASLAPIEQTAIERLHRLIRDCGYSAERLQNMYNELPPRKQRDDLVDHYFTTMFV